MSIKYYHLAKDEELPDEFCAIRDVGGEPSEYTFYVPEAENAKLREEIEAAKHDLSMFSERIVELDAENAKLRTFIDLKETCWKRVGWCDECPYNGVDDEHDDCNCTVQENINLLASELGIEVDA